MTAGGGEVLGIAEANTLLNIEKERDIGRRKELQHELERERNCCVISYRWGVMLSGLLEQSDSSEERKERVAKNLPSDIELHGVQKHQLKESWELLDKYSTCEEEVKDIGNLNCNITLFDRGMLEVESGTP